VTLAARTRAVSALVGLAAVECFPNGSRRTELADSVVTFRGEQGRLVEFRRDPRSPAFGGSG
jgi:hypothetical protein